MVNRMARRPSEGWNSAPSPLRRRSKRSWILGWKLFVYEVHGLLYFEAVGNTDKAHGIPTEVSERARIRRHVSCHRE